MNPCVRTVVRQQGEGLRRVLVAIEVRNADLAYCLDHEGSRRCDGIGNADRPVEWPFIAKIAEFRAERTGGALLGSTKARVLTLDELLYSVEPHRDVDRDVETSTRRSEGEMYA